MTEPTRIRVNDVRRRLQRGEPLLLVCAYPEDEKFRQAPLEGAIPFREFDSRKPSLPRDTTIVFYCG